MGEAFYVKSIRGNGGRGPASEGLIDGHAKLGEDGGEEEGGSIGVVGLVDVQVVGKGGKRDPGGGVLAPLFRQGGPIQQHGTLIREAI